MSHKSGLLQSVLITEGYACETPDDPRIIRFQSDDIKYVLDADDSDPGFFALRATFRVDLGLPTAVLLALAHDLGVAFKGVKVFVAPNGDAVGFHFEAFVPSLCHDTLVALLNRALRAIQVTRIEFEICVLRALLAAHDDVRAMHGTFPQGPVGLA